MESGRRQGLWPRERNLKARELRHAPAAAAASGTVIAWTQPPAGTARVPLSRAVPLPPDRGFDPGVSGQGVTDVATTTVVSTETDTLPITIAVTVP